MTSNVNWEDPRQEWERALRGYEIRLQRTLRAGDEVEIHDGPRRQWAMVKHLGNGNGPLVVVPAGKEWPPQTGPLDAAPPPAPSTTDGDTAWWRPSPGVVIWARPGTAIGSGLDGLRPLADVERDAWALLAAVAWARRTQC